VRREWRYGAVLFAVLGLLVPVYVLYSVVIVRNLHSKLVVCTSSVHFLTDLHSFRTSRHTQTVQTSVKAPL